MCGIAGILSLDGRPVPEHELRSMCAAMVHRGPDDEGIFMDGRIGLGMRRLSIIDLDTGRQPVANEDGTLRVVLNGEIYNYRELRRTLEHCGHQFRSQSDTETIVHLYEDYGPDCVHHLRGMFAFALWDGRRQRLVLARDRLGIKPLYYTFAGGRLAFASELKSLLQLGCVQRELNWHAVNHLFSFLTTPASESIVAGVHKLEPGHILIADGSRGIRIHRYWDLQFEPDRGHGEEYFSDRLRALLEESVRLHMVSDVPVGAFLSGGIDSSSVVATMARASARPVKTFTIGFREPEYNEAPFARSVAETFGTDHHEQVLDPDVTELLGDLTWYLDEPFGDSSAIPTYMVSRLASREVTVVLSGDGGDELFGGYDRYVVEARERKYQMLPRMLRRALGALGTAIPEGGRGRNLLRHLALDDADRYMDACALFRPDEKERLFQPGAFNLLGGDEQRRMAGLLSGAGGNWLSGLQLLDLKNYLPLDILTKVDRMSMACSIETRVPLLDHRLVEFAATIPPELSLHRGVTKRIFKRAVRGILPDAIINRRKQGFAVPLGKWFRRGLSGLVHELLLSRTCRQRGIFNPAHVSRLLAMHERGRDLSLQLWTLMSFELWCRTFLDRAVVRRPEAPSFGALNTRQATPPARLAGMA